jgi:hypothetical protein
LNERSSDVLNKAQYPSDVITLVVLWRLRYKLSLRDLAEMFLTRGFIFTYEAVREWEAKLTPALTEHLRRKRKGRVGRSWYVDETYIRVRGQWGRQLHVFAARLIQLCLGQVSGVAQVGEDQAGAMALRAAGIVAAGAECPRDAPKNTSAAIIPATGRRAALLHQAQ